MSLINQMLKDLQQQKNGEAKKPKHQQPKMMDRIPFLPMPVVLAGGALLVLCFIWWIAGILSDVMFNFEPAENPASQQVASSEQPVVPQAAVETPAEEDQLTEEERNAEAPKTSVAESAGKKVTTVVSEVPVPSEPAAMAPVSRVAESPAAAVKTYRKPASTSSKKQAAARVKTTTQQVKSSTPKKQPQAVSQAPKRLHPDQLPGAIASPRNLPEEKILEPRPSRAPANTPYGMAEEAYLDGQWALARGRNNLAIRSLQHSLELYPGHLPARELLVELLSKAGKTGEAMFLLAEGLEIAPDYMVFKKSYSRMLSEQGDYDEAVKVMLAAGLPPVDKDPEAHIMLASLYQRLDESFLAAQTYRNLLVAWPQTGAFWVGLGSALERQKLSDDAIICYQRALETKGLRQDLSNFAKKRLKLLN